MSTSINFDLATGAMNDLFQYDAFLVSKDGAGNPNVMTIGWGCVGVMWSRPVFMVAVRTSRHTRECLDAHDRFTVCIPGDDSFRKALALCGTKSGRDLDKFEAAGLITAPAHRVDVPVIAGCKTYYECRVLSATLMDAEGAVPEILAQYYERPGSGGLHILYFGEILDCYEKTAEKQG